MLTHNGVVHNCGHCMPCRINHTSQWTLRLLYELSCWQYASFVTLTYSEDNLPLDSGLHKSHYQNFMKNLRGRIEHKLKFYHCGEYGSKKKRPHYHAIIYGLDPFNEEHRKAVYDSWHMCEAFFFDKLPPDYKTSKSPIGKGMLPVCREDIAYVCGYVQKKLSGVMAQEEYGDKQRPYSTCSHYLGLDFALKNQERLKSNKFTFLNAKRIGIPRYLREKLNITFDSEKDFEVKNSQRIWKTYEIIRDEYYRKYPEMKGNISKYAAKHFERWYENKEFDLCVQLERDYLQLNHIRYGLE